MKWEKYVEHEENFCQLISAKSIQNLFKSVIISLRSGRIWLCGYWFHINGIVIRYSSKPIIKLVRKLWFIHSSTSLTY